MSAGSQAECRVDCLSDDGGRVMRDIDWRAGGTEEQNTQKHEQDQSPSFHVRLREGIAAVQ